MKDRPLRHWLEYRLYRMVEWSILRLSHATVRRLGHGIGRILFHLDRRHRQRALRNLARVLPELDAPRRIDVARRCFANYGAIFIETAYAAGRDPAEIQKKFEVEGWEHLEAAESLGRGVCFVSGHFGNWELALYPLGHRLGKIHLVGRPPDNPHIAREADAMRERLGHTLLERRRVGRQMLRVLRGGGRVAIVIDQWINPLDGILVPFMGKPAWSSSVVAFLCLNTGSPVVPVFCVPQGRDRFRLTIEPMILPEGKGIAAEAAMTRRYFEPLERQIRHRPDLWLWMHRRWRLTQPTQSPWHKMRYAKLSGLPGGSERIGLRSLPDAVASTLEQRGLVDDRFLEEAGSAVLLGGDAVLRSRIAFALTNTLLDAGYSVRYVRAARLFDDWIDHRERGELPRFFRELDRPDMLIVDGVRAEGDVETEAALVALLEQRRGRRGLVLVAESWNIPDPDPAAGGAGLEVVRLPPAG